MPREALIVIDMLNDFVREGAPLEVPDTRNILPALARRIEEARRRGNPVIYVCDAHAPDDREFSRFGWPAHGVRGSEGGKVVAEIAPKEGDIVVPKTTYSSFQGTELEATLVRLGIHGLVVTGCVTHICILFTAYEAVVKGYNVSVPTDSIAGLAQEDHDAAIRIMKNVLGVKMI